MTSRKQNSFYQEFLLQNVPRLITQIDRDPDSSTFGSCDRNYWHLKIRDFSSAILQQAALTLAILYKKNFPGNVYYNNRNVLIWIRGILDYWRKIQLNDGSFNEYYPNEHGFPPTAFSLFAIAETYRRLNLDNNKLLDSMRKTANFLLKNHETKAFNQEASAITALYSYYLIAKENWIFNGLQKKLDRLLKAQSSEGWFPEYGGADFGYLSVSLDMLAEYYWLSKDEKVKISLERLIEFLSYFFHPDATCGGEYGSRNTVYFLPNGIEVMINIGNTYAMLIKEHFFKKKMCKHPHNSIDDRYLSHYILHSYARAVEKEKEIKLTGMKNIPKLPCYEEHFRVFHKAGLVTFRTNNVYGIIALKKGGIVRLFKDKKEIFTDYGYRYCPKKNVVALNNWLDNSYEFKIYDSNKMKIKGYFNLIKQNCQTPFRHFLLRVLSAFLGRSLISFLKNNLIFANSHTEAHFIREIRIYNDSIVIEDIIYPKKPLKNFHTAPIYSFRHVASGKFYYSSELLAMPSLMLETVSEPVVIKHRVDLNNAKVELSHEKLQ